jgi:hypothetical protein
VTLAVCIKCGNKKLGALTPCRQCGFVPEAAEDQAKSIFLSDHNLSSEKLSDASVRIGRGESVGYDDAALSNLAKQIPMTEPKYILGVRRTSWIALGIAIIIGVLFGSCLVGVFQLLRL